MNTTMNGQNGVRAIPLCIALLFVGACNMNAPSSRSHDSVESAPQDSKQPDVTAHGGGPDELAKEGIAITQFNSAQDASLHVTMSIEGMDASANRDNVPKEIASLPIAGKEFSVPSDMKARWGIIDISQKDFPVAFIFTHRVGPSGTTYSIRQYDCDKQMVRYLATGATIQEMKASKADDHMSEIVPRSIAYYLGKLACTNLQG